MMVSDMNRLTFQIKVTRKEPTGFLRLMYGLITGDMEKLAAAMSQAEH